MWQVTRRRVQQELLSNPPWLYTFYRGTADQNWFSAVVLTWDSQCTQNFHASRFSLYVTFKSGLDAACKSYSLEGRHFVNGWIISKWQQRITTRLLGAHWRHSLSEAARQCEADMSTKSVPYQEETGEWETRRPASYRLYMGGSTWKHRGI